jgi:ABC-type sugar transport system ATPase subunit
MSFKVREGEILGLAGLGDAGGDRLLRALMGGARGGSISIAGQAVQARSPAEAWRRGMAYVPKERRAQGLLLSKAIADNVALPHLRRLGRLGVFLNPPAERTEAAALGRRVRLRATGPRQKVWRLSGGNQQKVMFARWLFRNPRVLILDEPTRGVDVAARAAIHRLINNLAAEGTAVLMISSEIEEVLGLAHRVLVMRRGSVTREFRADPPLDTVMEAAFGLGGGTIA